MKIVENPIKIDDLGVPLFLEIPIFQTKAKGFPSNLMMVIPEMETDGNSSSNLHRSKLG